MLLILLSIFIYYSNSILVETSMIPADILALQGIIFYGTNDIESEDIRNVIDHDEVTLLIAGIPSM